jgi:hypothetical protein
MAPTTSTSTAGKTILAQGGSAPAPAAMRRPMTVAEQSAAQATQAADDDVESDEGEWTTEVRRALELLPRGRAERIGSGRMRTTTMRTRTRTRTRTRARTRRRCCSCVPSRSAQIESADLDLGRARG